MAKAPVGHRVPDPTGARVLEQRAALFQIGRLPDACPRCANAVLIRYGKSVECLICGCTLFLTQQPTMTALPAEKGRRTTAQVNGSLGGKTRWDGLTPEAIHAAMKKVRAARVTKTKGRAAVFGRRTA